MNDVSWGLQPLMFRVGIPGLKFREDVSIRFFVMTSIAEGYRWM